jgi:hypothetical protein
MDLSQFDGLAQAQEEGVDVKIYHPKTGEEMGITIKVVGPESSRQKRIRNLLVNERLMRNRNRRPTAVELDTDALKISAAAILGWEGIEINGKVFEYSAENAEHLLTNYPFIREQIDSTVSDRGVFIKS